MHTWYYTLHSVYQRSLVFLCFFFLFFCLLILIFKSKLTYEGSNRKVLKTQLFKEKSIKFNNKTGRVSCFICISLKIEDGPLSFFTLFFLLFFKFHFFFVLVLLYTCVCIMKIMMTMTVHENMRKNVEFLFLMLFSVKLIHITSSFKKENRNIHTRALCKL